MARNEFSGIDEESYADGHRDGKLDGRIMGLKEAAAICDMVALETQNLPGPIVANRIREAILNQARKG
jgi:hypothetical protein